MQSNKVVNLCKVFLNAAFAGHCRAAASGSSTDSSSSSSQQRQHYRDPSEAALLHGLEDQLDTAAAELQHLAEQIQAKQAALATAHGAMGDLKSRCGHMSEVEVRGLLATCMEQLVGQSCQHQRAEVKVRRTASYGLFKWKPFP